MTVAVIVPDKVTRKTWDEKDFNISWFSGTGAGGQHRNKHQNSCRITHTPTGIERSAQTRSRAGSLLAAKTELIAALDAMSNKEYNGTIAADRKQQVGTGMRGDKRRTYRFQDNTVVDHITGKSSTCTKVMKGGVDLMW